MQVHQVKISKKPMMADHEIELIDSLLAKKKPKYCLEWGAGMSTLYFPKKHKFIRQWIAVEENGHYVDYLRETLPRNAFVVWEPLNEWYIDSVKHSRTFDFILVDGYDRARCIEIGTEMLTEDGILLLHDSGRAEYKEVIMLNNGKKLSDGEIPDRGGYAHRGLTLFRKKHGS